MNKKYIKEKLQAIEKEINKISSDKSYIMENLQKIERALKEKE